VSTPDPKKVIEYLKAREEKVRQKKIQERKQIVKKLKDLKPLWKSLNIERVYLYGSIARLNFHNESDIDVAIEGDINFKELLNLINTVGDHFKREIDIRLINELDFKEKILREGIIIYERENPDIEKRD